MKRSLYGKVFSVAVFFEFASNFPQVAYRGARRVLLIYADVFRSPNPVVFFFCVLSVSPLPGIFPLSRRFPGHDDETQCGTSDERG